MSLESSVAELIKLAASQNQQIQELRALVLAKDQQIKELKEGKKPARMVPCVKGHGTLYRFICGKCTDVAYVYWSNIKEYRTSTYRDIDGSIDGGDQMVSWDCPLCKCATTHRGMLKDQVGLTLFTCSSYTVQPES